MLFYTDPPAAPRSSIVFNSIASSSFRWGVSHHLALVWPVSISVTKKFELVDFAHFPNHSQQARKSFQSVGKSCQPTVASLARVKYFQASSSFRWGSPIILRFYDQQVLVLRRNLSCWTLSTYQIIATFIILSKLEKFSNYKRESSIFRHLPHFDGGFPSILHFYDCSMYILVIWRNLSWWT